MSMEEFIRTNLFYILSKILILRWLNFVSKIKLQNNSHREALYAPIVNTKHNTIPNKFNAKYHNLKFYLQNINFLS